MNSQEAAKAVVTDPHTTKSILSLAAMGAFIGIGQLLASKEQLTPRIIFGRAMSSAGLGAASAAVLVWFPDLPLVAQLGIAASIASLGTSFLEKAVQKYFGGH